MPNPWIAFVLGFISHFFIDGIPHGDQDIITATTPRGRAKQLFIIGLVDLFLLSLVALTLIAQRTLLHPLSMALGACGGMLPDALQGIAECTHGRFLTRFQRVHHLFHINLYPRFARIVVPLPVGFLLQIVVWYIAQSRIGL